MSAFIITATPDYGGSPKYWNENSNRWSFDQSRATPMFWSWAHEVININRLKETNPGFTITVKAVFIESQL